MPRRCLREPIYLRHDALLWRKPSLGDQLMTTFIVPDHLEMVISVGDLRDVRGHLE